MVLKLFRHISISLILAILISVFLFTVTVNAGYIFSLYFIFAGTALGLGAFLTPELPLGIKNLISIVFLALLYYCFNFLVYIDSETVHASAISEKSVLARGWHYISHITHKDLVSFWPVFTSKIVILDVLFLVTGLESILYLGWKSGYLRSSQIEIISEKPSQKTGDSILNKRRVKSKRFKRKF